MTTALGTGLRRAAARLAPDSAPTPDGELLSRFLHARDEAAFALVVRRHAGMVFGTCRRVLGNAADADDAFQAAFVVLVRKAHSLTDRQCVGNFLYGVAFHTALKARAMATKRRAKEAKATRPDSVDSGELTRVLDEELSKLSDKYREPVVLCELTGVSRKDAAARLGIPEGTVSSRLATAHRMLAKRLAARGFAAGAVAAVLTERAFAVPELLTTAVVRSAVDGPPAAVTQLASEVTKMLLWNKLKAGAVLAGVLLAAAVGAGLLARADDKPVAKAPAPVKEVKKPDDAKQLQGTWVTKAVTFDPPLPVPPGAKQEHAHHTLTFADKELTWVTFIPSDVKTRHEQTKPFKLDQTTSPKQLTSGDNECVYELDGDTLKVAMHFLTPDRPKGFNAKDSPPGKGHIILIELTREKDDKADDPKAKPPEKKPDADKSYSLKDGEVLKLIAAPFPEEREDIYTSLDAARGIKPTPPHDTRLMAVTVKDGKPVSANAFTDRKSPGANAPGKPLALFVQHALRTDMAKVADPHWLLDTTVLDVDVVLKNGANQDELLAALSKELQAKCGAKVMLKFEEVEREVVVISGKHTLNPSPKDPEYGQVIGKASVVHFVAGEKVERANSLIAGTRDLPGELAKFVGRPVIDESDLGKTTVPVTMTFHVQYPETADTRTADRDPEKVLQNLANQTGLTFKLGKQKVKALVVEMADKEPAWKADFDKLYTLADGEVVKYVHATTPAAKATREAYYREVVARGKKDAKPLPGSVLTFRFGKDGAKCRQVGGGADGGKGKTGLALEHILAGLFDGDDDPTVDFDPKLLNVYLPGDWVVRAGTPAKERAKATGRVLTNDCQVPVTLELAEAEREVLVASGEWKLTPRAWRKDAVDVYAVEKVVDKTLDGEAFLKGRGDVAKFLREAGGFAGMRVVLGEVRDAPKEVAWYMHERNSDKIGEQNEDHDADAILKNVSEQTGLTFKAERRKVPVLVASKKEK